MRAARVRGSTLAWEDAGAGEPVVCIHGAFIADAFRPLLSERVLTDGWRVVTYHRRGYGASSGATDAAPSLADQAADCWGLLAHLGVERAHVVGHSFGGAVALRLALDTPATVATLTLLEAGLLAGESEPVYRQGLLEAIDRYRHAGATAAVDAFLAQRWPPYRRHLDDVLPGAFAQAVADAGTCFDVDLPGGLASRLGELELRRLEQPTLVVLGEASVALHPHGSRRPTACCSSGCRTRRGHSSRASVTSCSSRTRASSRGPSPASSHVTRSRGAGATGARRGDVTAGR